MGEEEIRIRRLQENLSAIRKVAGWTAERLGDEIGVTRQTISNLEKGKTPMTKTQYLALRTVLNHEVIANENQPLAHVIRALVDDPIEESMSSKPDEGEANDGPVDVVESLSNITGMYAKAEKRSLESMRAVIASGAVAGASALVAAIAAASRGISQKR